MLRIKSVPDKILSVDYKEISFLTIIDKNKNSWVYKN